MISAWGCCAAFLGSRLIDFQSQKMTVAARATAEWKAVAQLSWRVAIRRRPFSLPTMVSVRVRRLDRRLSWRTALPRDVRPGMQGRCPLSFHASRNPPASWPRSAISHSAVGRLPGRAAAPVSPLT